MNIEPAIKLVKDTFQFNLAASLHLRRVTAPLFVQSGQGINDDLSGTEKCVSFLVPALGINCEIVHSLAKWKRLKLWKSGIEPGYGIYTDMNAIRAFEVPDEIHSIYVDQWDWEKVITAEQRNEETLRCTVEKIYASLLNTEYIVCEHNPELKPFLPERIHCINSEELLRLYPTLSPKERENEICKKYGAVFIIGIGGKLSDGTIHDSRAADYDDWSLNGDILIWYPVLQRAVELSSMGIRVNSESLHQQLLSAGRTEWEQLMYHRLVLDNTLPLTIGGGIGQSRLCMTLLHRKHIGEVQVSVWDEKDMSQNKNLLQ